MTTGLKIILKLSNMIEKLDGVIEEERVPGNKTEI